MSAYHRRALARAVYVSLVIPIALAASCPPKQTAVLSVQAIHTALSTVQDAEMVLYCVNPAVSPCAPSGLVPTLTQEKHQRFHAKLAQAFTVEADLAVKLKTWHPGDGPLTVPTLLEAADAVLDVATEFLDAKTDKVIAGLRAVLKLVHDLRRSMGVV